MGVITHEAYPVPTWLTSWNRAIQIQIHAYAALYSSMRRVGVLLLSLLSSRRRNADLCSYCR